MQNIDFRVQLGTPHTNKTTDTNTDFVSTVTPLDD